MMIFPTLSVAIYIMWKNRHMVSELTHNIAIALWISANSMWMIFEFTGTDEKYRNYCLVPFLLGLLVLLYYYGFYLPFSRRTQTAKQQVAHSEIRPSDPA